MDDEHEIELYPRNYFTDDGIPGGHECPYCGQVNTCYFVEGWYWDMPTERQYFETIKCDECGHPHDVSWIEPVTNPVRVQLVRGE